MELAGDPVSFLGMIVIISLMLVGLSFLGIIILMGFIGYMFGGVWKKIDQNG